MPITGEDREVIVLGKPLAKLPFKEKLTLSDLEEPLLKPSLNLQLTPAMPLAQKSTVKEERRAGQLQVSAKARQRVSDIVSIFDRFSGNTNPLVQMAKKLLELDEEAKRLEEKLRRIAKEREQIVDIFRRLGVDPNEVLSEAAKTKEQ